VTYALLLIAFLLVLAQEKRFFRRASVQSATHKETAHCRTTVKSDTLCFY
jgi:hypothetical protein